MVNAPNATQGAVDLGDGLTPIDIWQGLHANARAWTDVAYGASQNQDRILIDGTDLSVLKALSNYPAQKWSMLCEAVGWTIYGAVGLSWCADAELPMVWEAWDKSGFQLLPTLEFERPARLLNPALLPDSRKVSDIIKATTPNSFAFCALVAASDAPLDFDASAKSLANAPNQIAAFLKSRMLQVSNRSNEDEALIGMWGAKVKGTPFDVWSG